MESLFYLAFCTEPQPELPAGVGYLFYKRVLSNSPVLVSCFLGYYVLLRSLRSESVPLIEKVSYAGRDIRHHPLARIICVPIRNVIL